MNLTDTTGLDLYCVFKSSCIKPLWPAAVGRVTSFWKSQPVPPYTSKLVWLDITSMKATRSIAGFQSWPIHHKWRPMSPARSIVKQLKQIYLDYAYGLCSHWIPKSIQPIYHPSCGATGTPYDVYHIESQNIEVHCRASTQSTSNNVLQMQNQFY